MTLTALESFRDVWDKQVQHELISVLDHARFPTDDQGRPVAGDHRADYVACIPDVISTIIKIHEYRRSIMVGLYNRMRLDPATKFRWTDPRLADGVPIFARESPGVTKENHKLHTPFDRTIINNKSSYMVGIPPSISVAGDDEGELTEQLETRIDELGFSHGLSELVQKATGRGTSFVLLASPPGQSDLFITYPFDWTCVVLYDSITGEPRYAVRYWTEVETGDTRPEQTTTSSRIFAEFYDETDIYKFHGDQEALSLIGHAEHMIPGVPLVEFPNNTERIGDVELTLSLQDSFDVVDADLVNELAQLRMAYMWIRNLGEDVDDKWLANVSRTGVFTLDDNGEAGFLEKGVASTAVENLKADLERRIYRYSASYNPDEIGESGDMTAFQIRQRLFKLESSAKETETLFHISLKNVVGMVARFYGIDVDENDVSFVFTRNVPRNTLQDLKDAVSAGFQVSQNMMARIMPFEIDQEVNTAELAEESTFDIFADPGAGMAGPVDVEAATEAATLSGIQISTANEIIGQVAAGNISRDAGVAQLVVFLGLTQENAERVMGPQS